MDAIAAVRDATTRRLTAAGGITTMEEVESLDAMGVDAVVGMAIYTGRMSLPEPGSSSRNRVRFCADAATAQRSCLCCSSFSSLAFGRCRPAHGRPGLFSEQNARAHVGMLAGTIGSRPVGTPANARAREYIVDQLRQFGFEVRVQETDAPAAVDRADRARRQHHRRPARAAHRSRSASSRTTTRCPPEPGRGRRCARRGGVARGGAGARGARRIATWTLMVLVTDGEESGLMGAAALVTDRDVTSRLQAYINLESIGSAGTADAVRDRAGQRLAGVAVGARAAPHPRGGSFAHRDLPAPAERHRLLDPEAPGHSRPEFRRRRRQLRVSHRARHAGTPVAGDRCGTTGEKVVAIVDGARQRRHHAAIDGGPRRSSTSPGRSAVSLRSDGRPAGIAAAALVARRRRVGAGHRRRRCGSKACCAGC